MCVRALYGSTADLVMMFDDGDQVEMEGSSSFKESGGREDGTDFLLVWTETTWARTITYLASLLYSIKKVMYEFLTRGEAWLHG